MKGWIPIKDLPETSWKPETVHGVEIEMAFSPYDIPQAVRGYKDDASGRFVIEFRYLTEERKQEKEISESVKMMTGENSHRIYSIWIDVNALKASSVGLMIKKADRVEAAAVEAIDRFGETQPTRLAEKYELNKLAIQSNDREIFNHTLS